MSQIIWQHACKANHHHFISSMKFNSTDTCTYSREQDSKVQLEHTPYAL